uniref:Cyclin n=1 Tax=Neobodo designis TaxID=312471 RepID=A0A7S1LP82_NEODS|mmetsp:Transcript_25794/g.79565  ORF Transcript_25794/g.79565 Transcript_25794/m.79565 type:complete len:294 (+) Transcript_25794:88-969(+)|eukprot:CAMPEP_0174851702 /NCGR_PEP_ID=MMETSP1114-20130205/23426_1 /TAXON_ID=312471 /ORGANISM="Neobodo designis, Strain CCAP 1951/1" /LENGTH=293 /DNA_ID=CAMNT_0016086253 /DNA_START=84 /DNA_END=965 /DNA_ORIENTATION=+
MINSLSRSECVTDDDNDSSGGPPSGGTAPPSPMSDCGRPSGEFADACVQMRLSRPRKTVLEALGDVPPEAISRAVATTASSGSQTSLDSAPVSPTDFYGGSGSGSSDESEMQRLGDLHRVEFRAVAAVVADALERVTASAEPKVADFYEHYGEWAPLKVSLRTAIDTLADGTFVSPASLVAACVLLDRWCDHRPGVLQITRSNVYKLLVASLRVASKALELRTVNNGRFASAAGLPTSTVNELESRFIEELSFNVGILHCDFFRYSDKVHAAFRAPRGVAQVPVTLGAAPITA